MRKLFLDDIRNPKDCANGLVPSKFNKLYWENDWFIVRTHNEFVDWITQNGLPDFISFDHDLADSHYTIDYSDLHWPFNNPDIEKTGYDSAKWLGNYCLENKKDLPNFIVHSQNPVGKMNIQGYLDNLIKFLKK